ncbi:MAG: serine/threonine protein kinase [Actinomycetota bacterium]|nr:serine/threonine protein kinase [Actinomycetota bacterium]
MIGTGTLRLRRTPESAPHLPGYDLLTLMRRGARLDTYDAYSQERDCRCVVKTVRPDRAADADVGEALRREGGLLKELAHPHLVRAYEVTERPTAVVLETLTGATLAALVEDAALTAADSVLLGRHLTSVLGYLHRRGWLHLDVKPSNVVVQSGRAVLIDLSVAAPFGQARPGAGTWGYLSPEQVTGRAVCPAADVFGLGVTLGETLTGRLPYGEEGRWRKPHRRSPDRAFCRRLNEAPDRLGGLVLACVDPDPGRRPTLAQVRAALQSLEPLPHDRPLTTAATSAEMVVDGRGVR